jgi:hypothetical protein
MVRQLLSERRDRELDAAWSPVVQHPDWLQLWQVS